MKNLSQQSLTSLTIEYSILLWSQQKSFIFITYQNTNRSIFILRKLVTTTFAFTLNTSFNKYSCYIITQDTIKGVHKCAQFWSWRSTNLDLNLFRTHMAHIISLYYLEQVCGTRKGAELNRMVNQIKRPCSKVTKQNLRLKVLQGFAWAFLIRMSKC